MSKKTIMIILFIIILSIMIIIGSEIIYDNLKRYFLINQLPDIENENIYLFNNFNNIFKNIKNINSTNFKDEFKIDANRNLKNEYKIINLSDYQNLFTNIINHNDEEASIKKIVEECLKNITLNGAPIDINKCVIIDVLYSDIQTFPYIHTDIEWGVYDNSDGFQLWYLYKNDDNVGNMFIIETDEVRSSSFLTYNSDNSLDLKKQCSEKIILKFNNYEDINPTVSYLNMKEGECLIFGKNLYHMSDFRKSKYRYSINLRVIIKDEDGGIPINLENSCLYNTNLSVRLNLKNIKRINNKIYPEMFDLIKMI